MCTCAKKSETSLNFKFEVRRIQNMHDFRLRISNFGIQGPQFLKNVTFLIFLHIYTSRPTIQKKDLENRSGETPDLVVPSCVFKRNLIIR